MTSAQTGGIIKPMTAAEVDKLVQRILRDQVSTLPHIAARIMQVANDESAGADTLRKVVEADPTLSARIIKCVNSAAYALRNRVNNLHRAICLIGFQQVRNLAVSASVAEIFRDDNAIGPYKRSELWRHLVSVAIAARLIAMRVNVQCFEEAFLAGLLHDFGLILEDQFCHKQFEAMITGPLEGQPLVQTEQELLGFDHTILGARAAESWCFPEDVVAAIRFHHAPENYRGKHVDVVACVELANIVCTLKGVTSVGLKLLPATRLAIERYSLSREDIVVIMNDLDEELERYQELLNLAKGK